MLKKARNIYKSSHTVRTVTANLFSLSVLNILNLLIPLITLPYLVRVLGVEKYGTVNFSYSLVNYFVAVTSFGFALTGTRKIAQQIENKTKLNATFNNIFYTKIALGFISLLVFTIIIFLFPRFNGLITLYYFSFLLVLADILFPIWFFQGIEKMKYITYSTMINRIIYLVLIFTYIKTQSSFLYVPLFQGIGAIIGGMLAMFIAYTKFNIRISKPNAKSIIQELKEGYQVFISVLLPNLYNNSTTFILGLFTNDTIVGYYIAALKPINLISSTNNILTKTFYPLLAKNSKHHGLYKKLAFGVGFFLFIGTLLSADIIVDILLGAEYVNSRVPLCILSITPLLLAIVSIYGTNYLLVKNKDKLYLIITFITSILGLLGAFVFIYFFSYIGAAINLVFSRLVLATGLFIAAKKIKFKTDNEYANK